MKFSLGLPVDRVDAQAEFVTGEALAEMARAAEAGGFDGVYVTDHPAPAAEWLATGGHHALEPMVALSFAAAATTTVRVHTNLYVAAYRSPLLAAKSLASLDVLSGGRLVVGLGAGYLEGEFAALGVDFATRNQALDDAIALMKLAWTGEPVRGPGASPDAEEVVVQPRPLQHPHPPLWIGGNSKAAIRRAVQTADGWSPFANPSYASRTATAEIGSVDDLARRLVLLRDLAEEAGRTDPLDVCFTPVHLVTHGRRYEAEALLDELGRLSALGVTWVTAQFRARTRAEWLDQVARFATDVVGPATAGGQSTRSGQGL